MTSTPRPRTPHGDLLPGRRLGAGPVLAGVLVVALLAGLVWFLQPAGGPVGPAGAGGCVNPGGEPQDIDTADPAEYPWPHTPGEPVRVYFETGELPARYAGLVTEAAALWAASPCVEPVVVDRCPAGANCSTVITRASGGGRDTDGESDSTDRRGLRESNTITLYTRLLDRSSDNGALATIVHEMGHALGLVHRDSRDSVMNAETDDSTDPRPDEIDFANLARIYGS